MKKLVLSVASVGLLAATYSCNNAPKADEATATEAVAVDANAQGTSYNVDATTTKMEWTGSKAIGGSHNGTVVIKQGNVLVNNNAVTGGKFVIDMNTITPLDQDEKGNTKLKGHLTNADFFDVAKFPEATFEITSVAAGIDTAKAVYKEATHTVTGNLTLKGISKSITFPAKIEVAADRVKAHAEFNIDRTEWGVTYGRDESVKDKLINKEINFKLHVEAVK